MYDVIVIGGGVIGSAVARELSKYRLDILVVEKNPEIGQGTTKANSAIVHGGYDAKEGSLKARLNVRGNQLYTRLSQELDFALERTGSLVVAFSEEEMAEIRRLYERGRMNQVEGLEILDRDSLLVMEPNLSKAAVGGLHCSSAGIVCPFNFTYALMENAIENGVHLRTQTQVLSIVKKNQGYELVTTQGSFEARYIVNAAGLYSDRIARMAGDEDFTIHPRKGEYRILDKKAAGIVRKVIFQAPTEMGKGILVAPTVHGNVIIGPTAEDIDNVEDTSTTWEGIAKVDELSKKSVPSLDMRQSIRIFSGVRATTKQGDFLIYASAQSKGIIHAGGIDSPGLASAPAIAEYITELLAQKGLDLKINFSFNPYRRGIQAFTHLSRREQEERIAMNPAYGKIICRCESITEGEIIEAIHRPAGARTLDGVKRRVRPGSGRCQGGFCTPRVLEILSRELNLPMHRVLKEGADSVVLLEESRGGGCCEL